MNWMLGHMLKTVNPIARAVSEKIAGNTQK